MVRDIVSYVLAVVRLVIAIQLLRMASRNRRNLYWLAGVFLMNITYLVGGELSSPDQGYDLLLYASGLGLAQLMVVMFIHTTFYQGKKSPAPVFLAITLVAGITDIIVFLLDGPALTLTSLAVTVNWSWHAVITYRAYTQVTGDKYVEDWVKSRYKLMIGYCAALAFTGVMFIATFVPSIVEPLLGAVGLITLVGVILQFLVWVMPERFRLYLNRNYHLEEDIE